MTYPFVGREPPAQYVRVPAALVRAIRTTTTFVGVVSVLLSLTCGVLVVVLGSKLPTSHHPLNTLAVALGGLSALLWFLIGGGLVVARGYATGESLNVAGAGVSLRLLRVLWISSIVVSVLSCLILVMIISSSGAYDAPQLHFTGGTYGYMVLLIAPCVLAGVSFFMARRVLRPSQELVRKYSEQ